jgi:hypothetical protein
MPATVVLDEVHLTFRIPATLSPKVVTTIRRTLIGKAFTVALRRAVVAEMKRHPELKSVKMHVSR